MRPWSQTMVSEGARPLGVDPSLPISDPTEIPPPYSETGVVMLLSHCVFSGIADYRCPFLSVKTAYRSQRQALEGGGVAETAFDVATPADPRGEFCFALFGR